MIQLLFAEVHVRPEVRHEVRAQVQEGAEEVLPLQAGVPQRPHQKVPDQVQEKVRAGE